MTSPSAGLIIEDLTVAYGARTALEGVDTAALPGTSVAVIGPNGSGKSTLLAAIAGLARPTRGRVDRGDASVAIVLQGTVIDRHLPISVRDTIAMARYAERGLIGRFRASDRDAIHSAMQRLDVVDLASRPLHELSGGQRQRVLVAQGLAQQADILLLDEPVTGLDLASRQNILDAVEAERAAGRIVLMATHDLADAKACDQVLLIATRMLAAGTPEEVLTATNLREAFGGRLVDLGDEVLLGDHVHGDR